jgi:hypothetical protein
MPSNPLRTLPLTLALFAGLNLGIGATPALAIEPTIADAAPAESLLVASVKDWTTMKAAFDRTGYKALWSTAEVQALVSEVAKEMASEFETALTEAGIEKEDIVYPTGAIGMAMFMTEPLDTVAERIATLEGEMHVGTLAMADFGENADKFDALLEKFYDNQAEKFGSEIKQTSHGDLTITSMIPKAEDDADEDEVEVEEGEWDAPGTDLVMPFDNDENEASFHLVRTGTTYIFSDSIETLHEAIDRALDPTRPSVAEESSYVRSLGQHPEDLAGSVVFSVHPVVRLMAASMTAEQRAFDETAPDMSVILDAMGLMGVETASFGVRLDTPDAMMETTIGVLAPEKKGVLSMFQSGTPSFNPPSFVPSNASSVWQLVIDFKQIPQVVASVIESFPEPVRGQASAGYGQAQPIVQSVIDALGSDIYMAQTIAQPLGPKSQRTLVGIRITDALVFSNLATTYAPMAGLEGREFQGAQVFEQKDAGIAVGLGAEWLFVGTTSEVEDALRRAGAPGDDLLGEQERFKAAASELEGDAVMSSYADMDQTVRYLLWSVAHAADIADAQMAAFGMDEEARREMREAMEADQADWIRMLPSAEVILEHIGDTVGELRPSDDGFRGRTLFLRSAR